MKSLTIVVALFIAGAVFAEEPKKSPPQAHTPEWTNPTTGDPGVDSTMDELQKIVVLCAADHSSAEFQREWAAYVRRHKLQGDALDAAMQKILTRAETVRRDSGKTKGDRKDMIEWKKGARKVMHDVAMKSVRNTRA